MIRREAGGGAGSENRGGGLRLRRQQLLQLDVLLGIFDQSEEGGRELKMQGVFRAGRRDKGRGHGQQPGTVRAVEEDTAP